MIGAFLWVLNHFENFKLPIDCFWLIYSISVFFIVLMGYDLLCCVFKFGPYDSSISREINNE